MSQSNPCRTAVRRWPGWTAMSCSPTTIGWNVRTPRLRCFPSCTCFTSGMRPPGGGFTIHAAPGRCIQRVSPWCTGWRSATQPPKKSTRLETRRRAARQPVLPGRVAETCSRTMACTMHSLSVVARAILCAGLGQFHHLAAGLGMTARRTGHYLAWARPFFDRIRGKVGYVPGHVLHLWHGDLTDRRQRERHHQLAQFDFDPFTDLALAASGAWRWNSDKQELHAFVQHYFESRNEDGV